MLLKKILYFSLIYSSFVWSMDLEESPDKINLKKSADKMICTIMDTVRYGDVFDGDLSSINAIKNVLKGTDDYFLIHISRYVKERFQSDGNDFILSLIEKINKGNNVLKIKESHIFDKKPLSFNTNEITALNDDDRQNHIELIIDYSYVLKKIEEMNDYFESKNDQFFKTYIDKKDELYEKHLKARSIFSNLNVNVQEQIDKIKYAKNIIADREQNLANLFLFNLHLADKEKMQQMTKNTQIFLANLFSLNGNLVQNYESHLKQWNHCFLELSLSFIASKLAIENEDNHFEVFNSYLFKDIDEYYDDKEESDDKEVIVDKRKPKVIVDELMKEFDEIDKKRNKEKKKKKNSKKHIKNSSKKNNKNSGKVKKEIKIDHNENKQNSSINYDINALSKKNTHVKKAEDKNVLIQPITLSNNKDPLKLTSKKKKVKKIINKETNKFQENNEILNKKTENQIKYQEINKESIELKKEFVESKNNTLNKSNSNNKTKKLNKKLFNLLIKNEQLEKELKDTKIIKKINEQSEKIIHKQNQESFEKDKIIGKLGKDNNKKDDIIKKYREENDRLNKDLLNNSYIFQNYQEFIDSLAQERDFFRNMALAPKKLIYKR